MYYANTIDILYSADMEIKKKNKKLSYIHLVNQLN